VTGRAAVRRSTTEAFRRQSGLAAAIGRRPLCLLKQTFAAAQTDVSQGPMADIRRGEIGAFSDYCEGAGLLQRLPFTPAALDK